MIEFLKEFWQKFKAQSRYYYKKHRVKIIIFLLIFSFLFIYFWQNILISVETGTVGVKWNRFSGTVQDKIYGEGLYVFLPWDKLYRYNLRIKNVNDTMKLLTRDGLGIKMNFSYRYYILRDSVICLHLKLGPEFEEKYVKSEAKAAAMSIIGNYPPDKIYTLSTLTIQTIIKQFLFKKLKAQNIVLDNFLITNISLPETITRSIELKLAKEQLAMEFDYRLKVEEK
ncbi:MAG: prohibitin family protein, partial [Bacteroidota bacterium]